MANNWRHTISTTEDGDLEIHIFCCNSDAPMCLLSLDEGRDRQFSFKHRIRIKAVCPKPKEPPKPLKRKRAESPKKAVLKKEKNAKGVVSINPLPPKVEPVEQAETSGAYSEDQEDMTDLGFSDLEDDEEDSWQSGDVDDGNHHKSTKASSSRIQQKTDTKSLSRNPDKQTRKKPIACKFCEKTFPNHAEYWEHRKNPNYDKSMSRENKTCEVCRDNHGRPLKFATKAALMAHDCVHHNPEAHVETVVKQDTSEERNAEELMGRYPCPICAQLFVSEWTLHVHLKHHTKEHLYMCCLCSQPLSHWDKHSCVANPNRFKCGDCPSKFATRGGLAEHRRNEHDRTCFYCGKVFFTKVSRNQHLEAEHANDGVRCTICNKILKNAASLHNHMRHHRYKGSKSQCPICGVQVFQIKKHISEAHGQTKPLICDQCPKIFYTKRAFMLHSERHGPETHSCDYCPKKFSNRRTLSRHLHIHTKIRSYICETCGHKSTTSGNLQIHRRIHMAVKMFPCSYCEKSFNYKASLQSHMKSQHHTAPYTQL